MDNALTVAREMLKRAPLFDGHNDLPWVIRTDRAARGDVLAYELGRVHENADTDIPAPARGHGRGPVLGGVPADRRAASGAHGA